MWHCRPLSALFTLLSAAALAACRPAALPTPTHAAETPSRATSDLLELSSAAFGEGDEIPRRYTCDGQDVSPPLSWSGSPPNTKSFAIIVDDPDAPRGTWVHWVIFGIPADTEGLAEDVPAEERLADGSGQGRNSWDRIGYGGPCPPSGSTHRYVFKLYALDGLLDLRSGPQKKTLVEAMEGHILTETRLVGTYGRE